MNEKKSESISNAIKTGNILLGVGLTFPIFLGVPILALEFHSIFKSVLLNQLRNLYKEKVLNYETAFRELNSVKKLIKVSPKLYEEIFVKGQTKYDIDLIKKTYPEDYNFLIHTKTEENPSKEFNYRFQKITDHLDSEILDLLARRELIYKYKAACDENNKGQMKIYEHLIKKHQKGNMKILNKNTNIEVSEIVCDPINEKSKVKIKPIKLIRCLISRRKFINAFMKLSEEHDVNLIEYDDLYDLESKIDMHFQFKDVQENISDISNPELPKLRWIEKPRLLVYFIQQLNKHRVIDFMTIKMPNVVRSHFCMENGEDYTPRQISDAKTKPKDNKGARTNNVKHVPTNIEFITKFIGYLELS
jgi:hypothetical protein